MKKAREIYWLLSFFAQPLAKQWAAVPARMGSVWVDTGEFQCEVEQPTRLLAIVLVEHLNGWTEYFQAASLEEDAELGVLDELRILLYWFVLEGRSEVFRQPEEPDDFYVVGELYTIWKTVARLCSVALRLPSVLKWKTEDLAFSDFVAGNTNSIQR